MMNGLREKQRSAENEKLHTREDEHRQLPVKSVFFDRHTLPRAAWARPFIPFRTASGVLLLRTSAWFAVRSRASGHALRKLSACTDNSSMPPDHGLLRDADTRERYVCRGLRFALGTAPFRDSAPADT
jgi:hypothetical protein